MSQEILTDEEGGFSSEEQQNLFKLRFEEGEIEYLDSNNISFDQIKTEYMRILRLPQAQGGYGIDDVSYAQLMANDDDFIPNHPDLQRRTVANQTVNNLVPTTGGKRTNKGKGKRKTRKTRKTRKKRMKRSIRRKRMRRSIRRSKR